MRWPRLRRVKVHVYSPEAWAMVEHMQERIDREHAWVHRLEDEIARLRNVVDEALLVCVQHPWSGDDTARLVAQTLRDAQQKPRVHVSKEHPE